MRLGFFKGAQALPPGWGWRFSGPNSSRQITVALPASASSYSSRMRFFLASKLGSLERFHVLTA
jgi:hypothetical protein